MSGRIDHTAAERMRRYRARLRGENVPKRRPGPPPGRHTYTPTLTITTSKTDRPRTYTPPPSIDRNLPAKILPGQPDASRTLSQLRTQAAAGTDTWLLPPQAAILSGPPSHSTHRDVVEVQLRTGRQPEAWRLSGLSVEDARSLTHLLRRSRST